MTATNLRGLDAVFVVGDPLMFRHRKRIHELAALQGVPTLKGAKPAELPVEQPREYRLVVNLRNARTLGLNIPSSLVMRADEVIK